MADWFAMRSCLYDLLLQSRYLALDLEDFAIVALLSASLDMELLRHERDLE